MARYCFCRSLFGGFYGIVFMILSVGNDYYRTASLALGTETLGGCQYGISDSGTLHRDRFGVDGVEKKLGRHVIGRNRKLHERRSREDYKAYPVSLELVHKSGDSQFRPGQTVRGIVLRQHRRLHRGGEASACGREARD